MQRHSKSGGVRASSLGHRGSGGWGRPQNRDGFNASGDIITTARDFPWCIEIKHVEGWTLDQLLLNNGCMIQGWWQQTVEETPVLLRPLLLFKKNRQQEVATVFSSDPVLALIDCRKFETTDYLGRVITLFPLKFLLDLDPALVRVCESSRGKRFDMKLTGQSIWDWYWDSYRSVQKEIAYPARLMFTDVRTVSDSEGVLTHQIRTLLKIRV